MSEIKGFWYASRLRPVMDAVPYGVKVLGGARTNLTPHGAAKLDRELTQHQMDHMDMFAIETPAPDEIKWESEFAM